MTRHFRTPKFVLHIDATLSELEMQALWDAAGGLLKFVRYKVVAVRPADEESRPVPPPPVATALRKTEPAPGKGERALPGPRASGSEPATEGSPSEMPKGEALVGAKFQKLFPGHGLWQGTVVQYLGLQRVPKAGYPPACSGKKRPRGCPPSSREGPGSNGKVKRQQLKKQQPGTKQMGGTTAVHKGGSNARAHTTTFYQQVWPVLAELGWTVQEQTRQGHSKIVDRSFVPPDVDPQRKSLALRSFKQVLAWVAARPEVQAKVDAFQEARGGAQPAADVKGGAVPERVLAPVKGRTADDSGGTSEGECAHHSGGSTEGPMDVDGSVLQEAGTAGCAQDQGTEGRQAHHPSSCGGVSRLKTQPPGSPALVAPVANGQQVVLPASATLSSRPPAPAQAQNSEDPVANVAVAHASPSPAPLQGSLLGTTRANELAAPAQSQDLAASEAPVADVPLDVQAKSISALPTTAINVPMGGEQPQGVEDATAGGPAPPRGPRSGAAAQAGSQKQARAGGIWASPKSKRKRHGAISPGKSTPKRETQPQPAAVQDQDTKLEMRPMYLCRYPDGYEKTHSYEALQRCGLELPGGGFTGKTALQEQDPRHHPGALLRKRPPTPATPPKPGAKWLVGAMRFSTLWMHKGKDTVVVADIHDEPDVLIKELEGLLEQMASTGREVGMTYWESSEVGGDCLNRCKLPRLTPEGTPAPDQEGLGRHLHSDGGLLAWRPGAGRVLARGIGDFTDHCCQAVRRADQIPRGVDEMLLDAFLYYSGVHQLYTVFRRHQHRLTPIEGEDSDGPMVGGLSEPISVKALELVANQGEAPEPGAISVREVWLEVGAAGHTGEKIYVCPESRSPPSEPSTKPNATGISGIPVTSGPDASCCSICQLATASNFTGPLLGCQSCAALFHTACLRPRVNLARFSGDRFQCAYCVLKGKAEGDKEGAIGVVRLLDALKRARHGLHRINTPRCLVPSLDAGVPDTAG